MPETNQTKQQHYAFAGVELTIRLVGQDFPDWEDTMSPFRVERVTSPYCFSFQRVNCLAPPEGELTLHMPGQRIYTQGGQLLRYVGDVAAGWEKAHLRICKRGMTYDVQLAPSLKGAITARTILQALEAEHLLARCGSFALHCAYIRRGGDAILFTAPSGTGKSTQAELWRTYRGAEIINGDWAAVCVTETGCFAAGIPFAGSSEYCKNETLPIKAIVYLSQAPEDRICRLHGYEAFARVWEGISVNPWHREDVERVSASVQGICGSVPVFHLCCTPRESAVEVLERALGLDSAFR